VTRYEVIARYPGYTYVRCFLETGRTHQIRVHFQHIRHPLVGDPVYRRGTRGVVAFPRQALHACELSLMHPRSGKQMTWRAEPPRDMQQLLEALRAES